MSTIIFCAFISRCKVLRKDLEKRGIAAVTYYGGLGPKTPADRAELQNWLDGNCNVMIATVSTKRDL
jgi:superfamily II DNA helicase RecQ